ncbi:MAG: hypothetical protein EBT93_11375 [Alphaproteobacteria bacterium]|nr:hypothetical protein [Alphaproteobacteria bacterium]
MDTSFRSVVRFTKHMNNLTVWIVTLATAMVLSLAGEVKAQSNRADGTFVEVDVVAEETIAPTSRLYARVVTNPSAAVLAPVNAVMVMKDFKVGEFVEKGELIATQNDDIGISGLLLLGAFDTSMKMYWTTHRKPNRAEAILQRHNDTLQLRIVY